MKFFRIAFVVFMICLSNKTGFAQGMDSLVISGKYKNIVLKSVLADIEKQVDVKFSYLDEIIKNVRVTTSFKKLKISKALKKILDKTDLDFKIYPKSKNIIIFRQEKNSSSFKKKILINGKVLDAASKAPLVATNIQIDGTQTGTMTGENGRFTLQAAVGATLKVTYIGYKPEYVRITEDIDKIVIHLQPSVIFTNAIVIYPNTRTASTETGNYNLEVKQLEKVSGPGRDVLMSMKTLPGVSARSSLEARFSVRGGNPDENLVLINDTQVYSPYHLKWNKYGTSTGLFNLDLVEKVQLSSGGFSARYGDKLSSLLQIDYREGNREQFRGKASISLLDSRLIFEGPLTDKLTALVGARVFQWGYLVTTSGLAPDNLDLNFWDIQTHLVYRPSTADKLSLLYIRSGDKFIFDNDVNEERNRTYSSWFYGQEFTVQQTDTSLFDKNSSFKTELLALSWEHIFSQKNLFKLKYSYYNEMNNDYNRDDFYSFMKFGSDYFWRDQWIEMYFLNLSLKNHEFFAEDIFQITDQFELSAGFEFKQQKFDSQFQDENFSQAISNFPTYPANSVIWQDTASTGINRALAGQFESYKTGGYAQALTHLSHRITLAFGCRADYYKINNQLAISPRVNLSWLCSDKTTLRLAWGYFFQPPEFYELKYFRNSTENTKAKRAIHYIAGLETHFSPGFSIKLETYYKQLSNLISEQIYDPVNPLTSRENDTRGFCTGVDLQLRYQGECFFSTLSYGLLQAREDSQTDDISYFPRSTDQRHTLISNSTWRLPKNWHIHAQAFYGSGYAYTPSFQTEQGWAPGEKNSAWFPASLRIDLRFEKIFVYSNWSWSFYLDLYNITHSQQVYAYTYNQDGKQAEGFSPFFPFVGVMAEF